MLAILGHVLLGLLAIFGIIVVVVLLIAIVMILTFIGSAIGYFLRGEHKS